MCVCRVVLSSREVRVGQQEQQLERSLRRDMEPPEGNDVDVEWPDDLLPTKAGVAGGGGDDDGDDAERAAETTAAPSHDASSRFTRSSSSSVFNRASRHVHPGEGCASGGLLDHQHRERMMGSSRATAMSGTSHRVLQEKGGGDSPSSSAAAGGSSTSVDDATAAVGRGSSKAAGGFLCYECGLAFNSVKELQLHMVRKTAWSNQGLIGSRVSCLVDNREWHEGLVTQVNYNCGTNITMASTITCNPLGGRHSSVSKAVPTTSHSAFLWPGAFVSTKRAMYYGAHDCC